MAQKVFTDWGLNQYPVDPQTLRRDGKGALFLGALGAAGGYAAAWYGLGHIVPTQTGAWGFLGDLVSQKLTWTNTSGSLAFRGGLSLLTATAAGVLLFMEQFKPRSSLMQTDGKQYMEGEAAVKKAKAISQAEIKRSGEGVALSQDFNFSKDREATHTLVVGGVGSGKTTICHHILKGIFARGDAAIIVDWKGDFTSGYKGKIFNPLDKRSLRWKVAEDVLTELDAASFSSQIIPDPAGSADPFWSNAARGVLTAVVMECQTSKPQQWTWADLYKTACLPLEALQKIVQKHVPHAFAAIAESGKQTQGVLSQMLSNMGTIRVMAAADADNPNAPAFSVRQWLEGGKGQLILGGTTAHQTLCRGYMAALITSASMQIQALPESKTRRVWLVVDEFPKLGKCEAVASLIEFGRSKGARVVLLSQDLAQLTEKFGQHQTQSIVSMVGTTIIGRTAGGATAEKIAKEIISTKIVERRNTTTQSNNSKSVSYQRDEMLVVHPSKLQSELGLRGDHIQALILGLGNYALNLPWSFVNPKKYREPLEIRECFKSANQPRTVSEAVPLAEHSPAGLSSKTGEKEDGNDAQKEAISHELHGAIDPVAGAFLTGLSVLDLFASNKVAASQATPSHQQSRLKVEPESEQEQGD